MLATAKTRNNGKQANVWFSGGFNFCRGAHSQTFTPRIRRRPPQWHQSSEENISGGHHLLSRSQLIDFWIILHRFFQIVVEESCPGRKVYDNSFQTRQSRPPILLRLPMRKSPGKSLDVLTDRCRYLTNGPGKQCGDHRSENNGTSTNLKNKSSIQKKKASGKKLQ